MSENLYQSGTYKDYLRAVIAANVDIRGYQSRLAEAARCQRAGFSQILRGKLNLTMDQAFRLTEFWRLADDERSFFLLLVEKDRAVDRQLRSYLESQLATGRERNLNLAKRFKQSELKRVEETQAYYGHWLLPALHVLTASPRFRTTAKLASRLHMSEADVLDGMKKLASLNLVLKDGDSWRVSGEWLHIPKSSPYNGVHQLNWRLRAMDRLQADQSKGFGSLAYTSLYCIAATDAVKIRDLLVEAIERTRAITGPSPEDDVYGFNVDFFRI